MSKSKNQRLITQQDHGKALQLFLREELQISNRQAKTLLDNRAVLVNGKRVWMAKHPLRKGDQVEWPALTINPSPSENIEILYQDPYLIAVNKAPGLVSDRDPKSVETRLREQENNPALRALHRLDKETSGLLMFLRNSEHREAYLDLFRRQEIHKVYQALLLGQPDKENATIRKTLDGKSAESHFRVLKRKGDFCKVECKIGTGRLHQIRRHALELNCRVAGDRQYGAKLPLNAIEKSLPRQMLHAFSVEFFCPQTRKKVKIHAPLAADFQSAIKQMGLG
jgi:23S rRNA pseudouridine1911/1915/1917 synthase